MGRIPRNTGSNVLAGVLGVGLAVTVTLLLMLSRVSQDPALRVSGPAVAACPTGVRAPVCYDAQVANLGSASTNIRCEVLAGPGTIAVFANKLPEYLTVDPIPPSSTISLEMQVAPAGGDTVIQPELSCAVTGE